MKRKSVSLKKAFWVGAVLACLLGRGAEENVEVSGGGGYEVTRHATLEDALAACSGGETLTLLADVTVQGSLVVSKSVTFDLGGHTLKNTAGWFVCPTKDVQTLEFRNGTISAADCCFAFGEGAYVVRASGIDFSRGATLLYAHAGSGRLEFLEGCRAKMYVRFVTFASSRSKSRCIVRGGVVDGTIYDAAMPLGNLLTVEGGRFAQDPTAVLAPGFVAAREEAVVEGVSCAYRVRAADADEKGVATVTCADGVVRDCSSLEMALASCAPNGVVALRQDVTASFPVAVDARITLDLDGHALDIAGGSLFAPPKGAQGLTVKGGRCTSPDALLTSEDGSGATLFTNCTLKAATLFKGKGLSVALADCRATAACFFAANSDGAVAVSGGVYGVEEARSAGRTAAAARVVATGGRFGFDVSDGLPEGYAQICEEATEAGVACRYAVCPETPDIAARPGACILSASGEVVQTCETVLEALAACPDGGRVKMLKSCTADGGVQVPRSLTLDLNGLAFSSTRGDFLEISANAALRVVGGGGILGGSGSVFRLADKTASVTVEDCTLTGLCLLYGPKGATVDVLSGTFVATRLLASGNGGATLNIRGGCHAFEEWRDNLGNLAAGTHIAISGGCFWEGRNPLAGTAANSPLVAEGATAFYEEGRSFRGLPMPYAVYSDGQAAPPRAAAFEGLVYTNVNAALRAARGGGTVQMLADAEDPVVADGEAAAPLTLDLGGHRLAGGFDLLAVRRALDVRGGSLDVQKGGAAALAAEAGARLSVGASASLSGAEGTCALAVRGAGAACVFDGTRIATDYLVNWEAQGADASLVVRGDGTNTCGAILFPGASVPGTSVLVVRGGWWKVDPSSYVTNNHLVLRHAQAPVCTWRVQDWAEVCAAGWTFSPADGPAVAKGTIAKAPETPVVVSFAGEVPVRTTTLVDMSGVTCGAGALSASSFVCHPDLPRAARLSFENGVLRLACCRGTVISLR